MLENCGKKDHPSFLESKLMSSNDQQSKTKHIQFTMKQNREKQQNFTVKKVNLENNSHFTIFSWKWL